MAVVDCDREDLRQQVDVYVNRARRQRPPAAPIPPAQTIDVRERHRIAALRGCRDLGSLAHLVLAVAVDLGHRDLREVVLLEERQQVLGEVVAVVAGRVRLDLELLGGVPSGCRARQHAAARRRTECDRSAGAGPGGALRSGAASSGLARRRTPASQTHANFPPLRGRQGSGPRVRAARRCREPRSTDR